MTRTVMPVLIFPALLLAACSSTLRNGETSGARASHVSETEPLWIPDDVKHDPAARSSLMEQMRVQILQKTRAVPETNRLVVRERLRSQLDRAGFDMVEVAYILASLDHPREAPSRTPSYRKLDVASGDGKSGGGPSAPRPSQSGP